VEIVLSFRIEEKVIVTGNELFAIKDRLSKEGMLSLHPVRMIHSIYFDSRSNGMFVDSDEGILPRKKLRIRSYDSDDAAYNLETKISSIEGRFKTTKSLTAKERQGFLRNGLVDSRYGVCVPKVEISYSRMYYQMAGVRIKFDTNIRYKKHGSQINVRESLNVMEIKATAGASPDFLEKLVVEPRRRFSKFCRACMLTKVI
jgi:hypothetical protein